MEIIISAGMAFLGGIIALMCYRQGLREGRSFAPGAPVFKKPQKEERDAQAAKVQQILQNINAYNGSADNQKEVD